MLQPGPEPKRQEDKVEAHLPKTPIHPKLVAAGITEQQLEALGTAAILCQTCPDCKTDIFCTLTGEYYNDWKKGNPVAMILNCSGCKSYKFALRPEAGELLYEKEGTAEERDVIPLVESIPSLPRQK